MTARSHDLHKGMSLARRVGVLLLLIGAVLLGVQVFGADVLPPPAGRVEASAEVISKAQRGTFQDPAFSVVLSYIAQRREQIRAGQRVPYETYHALSEGQIVTIHYNPNEPFDWQLSVPAVTNRPSRYVPGVLLLVIGGFLLALPAIARVALRYDDFDTMPDDMNTNSMVR